MHRPTIGIAGAGLTGLSCALGLAQSDWPVELFEAAPDSGWARNGCWDGIENWTTEVDFLDQMVLPPPSHSPPIRFRHVTNDVILYGLEE